MLCRGSSQPSVKWRSPTTLGYRVVATSKNHHYLTVHSFWIAAENKIQPSKSIILCLHGSSLYEADEPFFFSGYSTFTPPYPILRDCVESGARQVPSTQCRALYGPGTKVKVKPRVRVNYRIIITRLDNIVLYIDYLLRLGRILVWRFQQLCCYH